MFKGVNNTFENTEATLGRKKVWSEEIMVSCDVICGANEKMVWCALPLLTPVIYNTITITEKVVSFSLEWYMLKEIKCLFLLMAFF